MRIVCPITSPDRMGQFAGRPGRRAKEDGSVYVNEYEVVRKELAEALRSRLARHFVGRPVIELQSRRERVRADNEKFVTWYVTERKIVYQMRWSVTYRYSVDDTGVPVIREFFVALS